MGGAQHRALTNVVTHVVTDTMTSDKYKVAVAGVCGIGEGTYSRVLITTCRIVLWSWSHRLTVNNEPRDQKKQ